ncbi:MAG: hypothetical protein K2L72_03835, partial [Clostridia bacterium]|nr:hypothetical protein [Clostridia bacterium]
MNALKKNSVKFGALMLAAALSASIAGCTKPEGNKPENPVGGGVDMSWNGADYKLNSNVTDFHVDGKIHDYTATETDGYLLQDG